MLEIFTKASHLLERLSREYSTQLRDWGSTHDLWLSAIISTAGRIHSKLNKPADASIYHTWIIFAGAHVERERQKDRDMASPWDVADHLDHLLGRDKCARPECLQTFASTGSKFMYCSACRRTPYCSIECQRGDVSTIYTLYIIRLC